MPLGVGGPETALRQRHDFGRGKSPAQQAGAPALPPFLPALLAAVGIIHCDLTAIRNILAAYNRTNAMALVALSALLYRLDE